MSPWVPTLGSITPSMFIQMAKGQLFLILCQNWYQEMPSCPKKISQEMCSTSSPSHHSGLPDGPMPYNDNNMLCLGINKPSYVVFHVIGVCQKDEKVGAMTMDEK